MSAVQREVYISTTCFVSRHLDEILALCDCYRISALELSSVGRCDAAMLRMTGCPQHYLVHNYFPPPSEPFLLNLASQDEKILARSLEHCRTAIDLSAELGAALYAAHGGFAADFSPDKLGSPTKQAALLADNFAPYEGTYATLLKSAKHLADYGRERGVKFLIENHVLSPLGGETGRKLLPMVEAEELLCLAEDVGDPNFGILLDAGHLSVSAATLGFDRHKFIDTLAPYISAFHLSENDGVTDQHGLFGGEAWFLPRLKDFPRATITIELAGVEIDRILAVRDTVSKWL